MSCISRTKNVDFRELYFEWNRPNQSPELLGSWVDPSSGVESDNYDNNHVKPKILGISLDLTTMSDPIALDLVIEPHPRPLGLASKPDLSLLGLEVMPHPRQLSLPAMPHSYLFGLVGQARPNTLGSCGRAGP